jgi:hypothetical protein
MCLVIVGTDVRPLMVGKASPASFGPLAGSALLLVSRTLLNPGMDPSPSFFLAAKRLGHPAELHRGLPASSS